MNKEKNNYIEALRFLMCLVIVIHHSGFLLPDGTASILPSGFLAADFFFILTGYLSFVHVAKTEVTEDIMKYSFSYTVSKLKGMLAYILVGILPIYALEFFDVTSGALITDRIFNLQNLFFEVILLPMSGVMRTDLLSFRAAPLWYVSVLLIALPVIIYLSIRYKDVFFNYAVYVLPAILYGYLISHYQGLTWGDEGALLYSGVVRGFADMLLGGAVYKLTKIASQKKSIIATIIEGVILLFVLYSCHRTLNGYDQVFVVYLCGIIILISESKGYSSLLKGKLWSKLGSLSMGIYCLHWMVYKYIKYFFGDINVYLGIAICFLISLMISFLIKAFLRRGKIHQ